LQLPGPEELAQARDALVAGGVIACPTEAVWGLSCDPSDGDAVARLLALKERPVEKGLILVAADPPAFDFILDGLTAADRATLAASWPGPATWLVEHRGRVPRWISGEHATVALRVSDHPVLRAICEAFGGPLVSTSANPAGAPPARAETEVRDYFGDALDAVLPGDLGDSSRPTTIRDLASGEIIRA